MTLRSFIKVMADHSPFYLWGRNEKVLRFTDLNLTDKEWHAIRLLEREFEEWNKEFHVLETILEPGDSEDDIKPLYYHSERGEKLAVKLKQIIPDAHIMYYNHINSNIVVFKPFATKYWLYEIELDHKPMTGLQAALQNVKK